MNASATIRLTQTIIVAILVITAIYAFSQTTIYSILINFFALGLRSLIPSFNNHQLLAQAITLLTFFSISLIIGLVGKRNRIGLLCFIAFVLYIPSVEPFSKIDWLYYIGIRNTLEVHLPMVQVLLCGIIIMFCYLSLICLSRINETKRELTNRGGDVDDIDKIANSQIFFTFIVIAFAAFATLLAGGLLMIGNSALTTLIAGTGFAGLILGIGSVAVLSGLIFYYLKYAE